MAASACGSGTRPRLLGAILAGGRARRFGSDKAAATIGGVAMIEHVVARLRPQVDALIVCGRAWPGLEGVADLPAPGQGPLGGLAGALGHARRHGFDAVLSSGCDLPDLPDDLAARLGDGPAVVTGQPLLGLWPAGLADALLAHLAGGGDRSMRGWIAASGARPVDLGRTLANINTPEQMAAFIGDAGRGQGPS